jgi:hypothetical protein
VKDTGIGSRIDVSFDLDAGRGGGREGDGVASGCAVRRGSPVVVAGVGDIADVGAVGSVDIGA